MATELAYKLIWIVSTVLLVVLASRLLWHGLSKRYRAFFVLICLLGGRNAVLEIISPGSPAQFWFWLYTEPVIVLAFVVTVFEIYSLALQRFQGIRTISRRILTWSLVIASLVSVLSVFPDIQVQSELGSNEYLLVNVIRRGVYTSLLAFLVLLVSLISIFPIRLSKNTVTHVVLFALMFLFYSGSILMVNLVGVDLIPVVNLTAGVLAIVSWAAWILLLSPAGERVEASIRSKLSPDEAEVLMRKLRAVNESLSDSGRLL